MTAILSRVAIGIYLLTTSVLYLQSVSPAEILNIRFFYPDQEVIEQLNRSIAADPPDNIFITRIFHNKPVFYMAAILTSVFKILDPVFIFGLSAQPTLYDPYIQNYRLLFPVEIILFILSLIYISRYSSHLNKNAQKILLFAGLLALMTIGVLRPWYNQVLLIPLVLGIRLFIAISLTGWIRLWTKK